MRKPSERTPRLLIGVGVALVTIAALLITTEAASITVAEYPQFPKTVVEQPRIAPERVVAAKTTPLIAPLRSIHHERGINHQLGQEMAVDRGWVGEQFSCLDSLWSKESGWEAGRLNKTSFAAGIPQALPGTKIYPNFWEMERVTVYDQWGNSKLYLANPDSAKEIAWGLDYIEGRYGTPCGAWSFFLKNNWY